MEITSFNPLIISEHAADIVELFEDLAFNRTHRTNVETGATSIDLVDDHGFRVDVVQMPEGATLPRDVMEIRMNVRDFDKAYQILLDHGFTNTRGDDTFETGSAKTATMVAPSGMIIALTKHHRKED